MQNLSTHGDRLRLFEVLDVEKAFSQVIFARDMLRCDIRTLTTQQIN